MHRDGVEEAGADFEGGGGARLWVPIGGAAWAALGGRRLCRPTSALPLCIHISRSTGGRPHRTPPPARSASKASKSMPSASVAIPTVTRWFWFGCGGARFAFGGGCVLGGKPMLIHNQPQRPTKPVTAGALLALATPEPVWALSIQNTGESPPLPGPQSAAAKSRWGAPRGWCHPVTPAGGRRGRCHGKRLGDGWEGGRGQEPGCFGLEGGFRVWGRAGGGFWSGLEGVGGQGWQANPMGLADRQPAHLPSPGARRVTPSDRSSPLKNLPAPRGKTGTPPRCHTWLGFGFHPWGGVVCLAAGGCLFKDNAVCPCASCGLQGKRWPAKRLQSRSKAHQGSNPTFALLEILSAAQMLATKRPIEPAEALSLQHERVGPRRPQPVRRRGRHLAQRQRARPRLARREVDHALPQLALHELAQLRA